MSLMTAVSGGASLLLLLIPGKYEISSTSLLVTCCHSTDYCQALDSDKIYSKVFRDNIETNVTAFCLTDSFGLTPGERCVPSYLAVSNSP